MPRRGTQIKRLLYSLLAAFVRILMSANENFKQKDKKRLADGEGEAAAAAEEAKSVSFSRTFDWQE